MLKLASLSSLLAAGLLLAGSLSSQRPRLPGIPMVPPPVNHPALAGQPLIGKDQSAPKPRDVKVRISKMKVVPDPSTTGVKRLGKALKKAVAKVKALPWNRRLTDAKRKARARGKPILLLQTLGDIGGLA